MLHQLLVSWASIYSNHAAIRTGVGFLHILGLVAGGGAAITADLATIIATREGPIERTSQFHLLKSTHQVVVLGLVALVLSGLLLFAADVDTYLYSKIFWIKMGLVLLLVVNGAVMVSGERRVAQGAPHAWLRLHYIAAASLAFWVLTTLAGSALPNL